MLLYQHKVSTILHSKSGLLTAISLATWLGITPHISSMMQLRDITQMATQLGIPHEFAAQASIQRQIVTYTTALSDDVDSSTGATLLSVFNSELDNITTTYQGPWTTKLEIQLLAAKLYLFSLSYTHAHKRRLQRRDGEAVPALNSDKILIQRGLPFAVSLVHQMSELRGNYSAESEPPGTIIYFPKYYFRLTMFAVCFLMKFLSANPGAAQEVRELAITHIVIAHRLFSSFPNLRDLARTAEVIEIMVKGLRSEDDNHQVPIRGRLGASMLYNLVNDFQRQITETTAKPTAVQTSQTTDAWDINAATVNVPSFDTDSGSLAPLTTGFQQLDAYNNFLDPQMDLASDHDLASMSNEMYFDILGMSSANICATLDLGFGGMSE